MTGIEVRLPAGLAEAAGGRRSWTATPAPATVAELLDALRADLPAVERRIRDEAGVLRRFVNVYVDGDDVRHLEGVDTPLRAGAVVLVIPSVAGG